MTMTTLPAIEIPDRIMHDLGYMTGLSVIGYFITCWTIPLLAAKMPAFLTGKDLCKRGTPAGDKPVPEALGIVAGTTYVVCMIFGMSLLADTPQELVTFAAGLLSICFMMFLGFADDVLDLPWRYKLILPPIASLPILVTYSGATAVLLPKPIRFIFASDSNTLIHDLVNKIFVLSPLGDVLELGMFYKVYMGLMAVFCTNAINIYAGINGLEAGQAFVIGGSVLIQNIIQIMRGHDGDSCHLYSAMFMIPFLGTTAALLRYNWYPSRVFVGDTFCYTSGMTFAVAGIQGHFSKTLLLFFMPQVLNFLISIPQLFKFVPCPRHRLPTFDAKSGLLQPSRIPNDGRINFTLLNAALVIFGPMKENRLCAFLLAFQVVCCAMAFVIRYYLATYFYDIVQ